MANQNAKSFVNSVVDAQKQAVDTMMENAKKFTNGNAIVNETVQKGTEWYKNWLDSQKNIFSQSAEQASNMGGNMQNNMDHAAEFYKNWYQTQMNMARQAWEMNTSYFQNAAAANNTTGFNPMAMWQQMQQNFTNWMATANNTNQWMNMMQQWNNMFGADSYKQLTDNWSNMFSQYQELMQMNWSKMQEQLQQPTTQDAWKNMVNASESFKKFYEMWMPMWKNIQNKTFTMDIYKQWMNPAVYKDLMDKYLGLMPEQNRAYFQQMTSMMQDGMKQMTNMGMQQFQQARNLMGNAMPNMAADQLFGNMMNGYNQFQQWMSEAAAPFTKMMSPNQHTKTMMEWQDISNRIAVYNIRNAELQYMMYTQGLKAMDALAENVAGKISSGEEISSIMSLFQEWMNLSDKTFVSLFETDEYSRLMAEVSAMQLKLKKDIEVQMEKFMTGIPVATRSEMDELYKTIYELKKQVRQMEKMMDLGQEEVAEEPVKTSRRSSKK